MKTTKIAKEIVWMLINKTANTPEHALKIWQTESNKSLSEGQYNEIITLIEW